MGAFSQQTSLAPSSTGLSKDVSGLLSPSPQCSLSVLLSAPSLNASTGTILRGDM